VSEETRARPSSPDEIEVTDEGLAPPSSEPVDPKAARRARRAKAKMALRIPDDEVSRPQTKANGEAEATPHAGSPGNEPTPSRRNDDETVSAEAIKPSRIISVGPPPPDAHPEEAKTTKRIPSSPPTAPLEPDDEALTPALPPVSKAEAKTMLDLRESGHDDDDIDVPVDEDEPVSSRPSYRPKVPTIPSHPPPAETAVTRAKAPSEDALEIDDVEAAAVLSSRPPPRPMTAPIAPIPAAPRVPAISSKPPAPPPTAPLSPPIPVDAMSSTPQLSDPNASGPRPLATALVDDEEARGIEEIEPDRSSAPPSIDSGDEIQSTDVLVAAASAPVVAPARSVSTPPKPPPPKPPLPFRETLKEGTALAPKEPKETLKEGSTIGALGTATPAGGITGVQSPLAPPALHEGLVPRRRARPWWEDLFNDDFIRTMPKFTDAQIGAEVDFIEDSLGVAKGGTLLDLGCGTGRHAIDLSRRGYSVVGFDLSLAMLARAGEEAQERNQKINFVQGDMREMTFEEAFDGIFCWGTTFGFFEEEKNIHVLTRVHKALRHGGQFLLDVVCRDFIIKQSPSLAWFEGEGCVCMDEMSVDWITSRMRVKRTMMLDDGRSKEIEYSIRVYSLHELGKLLHDNGFRVAEISGRIQTPGVFFGPESPRTLILAEKR
jgi:SAM-dependent methyltransferase